MLPRKSRLKIGFPSTQSNTILSPNKLAQSRLAPQWGDLLVSRVKSSYAKTGIPFYGTMPNQKNERYRIRPLVLLTLMVAALLALPFDVTLARFFMSDPFPGELRSLIHKVEFFGHGYGILGIAFTIYLLCEPKRKHLYRLLSTALLAGVMCDAIKLLFHRVRPVDFSFANGESTFLGLSFLHGESWSDVFNSAYHSFPSAHTATSVAFAIALGAIFPKAAKWFLTLAVTVAVSRFDGGAHYVSDTCIGGLIGYVAACWMLGNTPASRWFTAFESQQTAPIAYQQRQAKLRKSRDLESISH